MTQERNPVDDAHTERERHEQVKLTEKIAQEQWADDLKFVMSDRRGRRVIWRLLVEAGVYRTVFSESPAVMGLMEGKRQLGLFLVAETDEICPQEYDRMKAEQRKNARSDASSG